MDKREQCLAILSKLQVAKVVGTLPDVSVSSVITQHLDGTPFVWDGRDEDDEDAHYAILNLRVQTVEQQAKAQQDLDNENYDDAMNSNLSIRIKRSEASKYSRNCLVNVTFGMVEVFDEDTMDYVMSLRPTGVTEPQMVKGGENIFASQAKDALAARKAAKLEARKAKLLAQQEAENE